MIKVFDAVCVCVYYSLTVEITCNVLFHLNLPRANSLLFCRFQHCYLFVKFSFTSSSFSFFRCSRLL